MECKKVIQYDAGYSEENLNKKNSEIQCQSTNKGDLPDDTEDEWMGDIMAIFYHVPTPEDDKK
ncbi:MAG: hypothetical protein IIY93_05440 [Clostridia bacterium]|nr:hypothetical protein [Clostridia bacterium]